MTTFTIYDERLVTVETFTGRLVLQDARDIAEHLEVFMEYQSSAMFGDEARTVMATWASALRI